MITNFIVFLALNLFVICTAFSQSPLIQFQAKSSDAVSSMKQVAAMLNVQVPGNWADLMGSPTSSGSHGQANVGDSTLDSAMTNWAIPEQFRNQAVNSVRLLVLAAAEGTYSGQAFSFDVASGASLTTLLVVVTRISSPVDPNLPFAIMYVTINTNAQIKQLFSYWTERVCHKCPKCLWMSRCCCHDEQRSTPRGHTPAELNIVRQKMTADQFIWFNQQTIQTNLTSLKLSSQAIKFNGIEKQNLPLILKTLSEDYEFDDIYSNPNYSQQLESPQFSYENLFSSEIDTENNSLLIKYIWILGQLIDNSTCTINFLSVDITSKTLIKILLLNTTTNSISSHMINKNKQLNIVRTSTLSSNGEFFNEHLLTSITSWQKNTTRIVLNMLRFLGATILIPQRFRMLSSFDTEIIMPKIYRNNANQTESNGVTDKIKALANSVSTVVGTFKEIIQTLKTSKSMTIERIIRFGFTYFNQKTTILQAIDIPRANANEFVNAVIMDYNLPSKGSFMLGLTYSNDFAWEQIQYVYSPEMNGKYHCLTLFKNGDSITNTASFFIVNIDADWTLAPDLLLINKTKSILGGLYSSSSASLQEVPHILTIDEAVQLQKFFMLIAIGNMVSTLGVNTTIPQIN
ncbi:unnamed protein product [Rotaria sordida]|uniref:Uncharacterized protein n=1 Tax=Rotaria sordida TaxID=392033 RepID=A0A813QGN2_9BILA|nr:unnamed protein product [Rotaria sordida]CAF0841610.1 unnamed protein product [Rotaria sordida]CAF3655565.1 unnamed protein product [Rotaria sordida]CAF3824567.1 unnamed protein product [Rotaria sordida]